MRQPIPPERSAEGEAVSVRLANGFERRTIERLSQFYIYDFSEIEPPGSNDLEFREQGDYSPLPGIDNYWRVAEFHPLLVCVKGRLAGFALINNRSRRSSQRVQHNMAEFFVARKYRRRGVATEAVRQILARYPGQWEIAAAERNVAAKAFWPRAIGGAPNVAGLVQLEGDGELWRGLIWSFRSAARAIDNDLK
jgi:predicted acetyltransferase